MGLVLPVALLSGCLWSTRKLPIPKAPTITRTATPEELVARLNQRWDALNSLVATVEIQASVLKTKQGVATDYTSVRGHILIRKPEQLRVYGQVPVLGTPMFDMASDGKNFSLYIPPRKKAVRGPNEVTKKSTNSLENMRPGFFLDAMVVRGLNPNEFYSVAADTDTVADPTNKRLLLVPEYILSVVRRKAATQELAPVRVVHFHRDDLMPYQQDLYDKDGNLETQVFYSDYTDFGSGGKYPARVTIKRPLEEYQLVLMVEKVVENMKLTDDQFHVEIPEGTKIQTLQ